MSEVKFTKSRWYAALDYKVWSAERPICKIETGGPFWNEEEKANANLIAATPDMYAMLKDARKALLGSYDATDYPADGTSNCEVVAYQIGILLAKARGE